MASKSKLAVMGDFMEFTLRCTHVTPHPDGTQTVTFSEVREPLRAPVTGPVFTPHARAEVLVAPRPEPLPVQRAPLSMLITGWPNKTPAEVGRSYRVNIETV